MISDEDIERAEAYLLISRLFSAPPDSAIIEVLGALEGDNSELGQAVADLARAARETPLPEIDQAFADLFVTLTVREDLSPYGAVHLTGSMFGEALLVLREDLRAMGIVKAEQISESEDHISVLCQIMAGLIQGKLGKDVPTKDIAGFYAKHLNKWIPGFLKEVEAKEEAHFYRSVARFARLFFQQETVRYS